VDLFGNKRMLRQTKHGRLKLASHASGLFWQLSEHHFLNLVNACDKIELIADMRKKMAALAFQAFDAFCPKDTARQIDAWASSRPNLSKYLFNN